MARPTIFDHPMTAAERMRRHREAQKLSQDRPALVGQLSRLERLRTAPRRVQASVAHRSLRYVYYAGVVGRHAKGDWAIAEQAFEGPGRVGIVLLATICKHCNADEQGAILRALQNGGALVGRALAHVILRRKREDGTIASRALAPDILRRKRNGGLPRQQRV